MSQCEEGVKVLSRIIFYLLLEKLVSRLRTPRSRTAARWKKLLTGNYVIIQVYFTSHNISTYISERARGWKNANRGHRLRARARAKSCLSRGKVRAFYFASILVEANFQKMAPPRSFQFIRENKLSFPRVGPRWYIYKMIHK